MDYTNYFFAIVIAILLFMMTSCSFSYNGEKKQKITVEKMPPLTETNKINCSLDTLTELEITKCKMEARLLELKY